ncbi:hypothetical protein LVD15_00270 [Fulvivirga maritima]|uniref:HEPN family nuclease n=1 Tax=Fulvivirga maritima TaxID=2904247 RepID=UPI001F37F612|nr:HEPN family nuclease [Fulvivirga maritima]UII26906.1 hypothetical protein LVD15_00270 [Fulvivirga maritima]
MGNYKRIEFDFINRTLALISQYENNLHKYPYEEQYNYTLLINCLLGLIVMPKEKVISHIPNGRLTKELLQEMGLEESQINPDIIDLRDLIMKLRHSVAHFDIRVKSYDDCDRIDEIIFLDQEKNTSEMIRFRSTELLPFIRYYASWLQHNIQNYGQ